MKIEYPYDLSNEQAYEKINKLMPELQAKYSEDISNAKWNWDDDKTKMDFSMEVKGFEISGDIRLSDGKLTMEGDLPLIARPFSSKIEEMITSELHKLLG